MPTIVHFEIPADDMERARTFYTDLFGWSIEPYEGSGEYWMVETTDENGEKSLEGGMMKRQAPNQPILNYINVPSVDECAKKVLGIGGTVMVPKTVVPNMGYFAVCLDTEGNSFGIWESDPEAGIFATPAEAFIAVLAPIIAADSKYSVDEMRMVWNEVEEIDLFKGEDYKKLESKVFGVLNKSVADPTPFEESEIDLIVASAKKMLGEDLQKEAFKAAMKLAHADRSLEGYVKEIDEREQKILKRLKNAFAISDKFVAEIMEELKPQF